MKNTQKDDRRAGQTVYRHVVVKLAPVNPDVLDWAVSEAGLSLDQLAHRSKVPRERLQAFLKSGPDRELPKTGEFRALAKTLNRPLALFFLPTPPASSQCVVSFRHPVERRDDEPLFQNEQEALRSVARWQRIIEWVRRASDEPGPSIPKVEESASVHYVAQVIREWLSWNTSQQKTAPSSSAVLRLIRGSLEEQGILVLQFSLGEKACKGFSVPHTVAPAVALNSSYNPAARVYTIFHELAHLVRGDRAVCGAARSDSLERWCEQVAAAVLMPVDDISRYVSTWLQGKASDLGSVRRVANHYKVSLRAAAIQLEQLGRAVDGLYDLINLETDLAPRQPMPTTEPQTRAVRRIRELGSEIARVVLKARQDGLLSETQVLRYLKVDRSELEQIAERVQSSVLEV